MKTQDVGWYLYADALLQCASIRRTVCGPDYYASEEHKSLSITISFMMSHYQWDFCLFMASAAKCCICDFTFFFGLHYKAVIVLSTGSHRMRTIENCQQLVTSDYLESVTVIITIAIILCRIRVGFLKRGSRGNNPGASDCQGPQQLNIRTQHTVWAHK